MKLNMYSTPLKLHLASHKECALCCRCRGKGLSVLCFGCARGLVPIASNCAFHLSLFARASPKSIGSIIYCDYIYLQSAYIYNIYQKYDSFDF